MAKGTTTAKGKSTKAKAEPDEDLQLDEVAEDDVEEAPTKGGGGQEQVTFGVSHLAEYLSKESGKKVTTRELRTLIRKMARDGSGRVTREIVAGNRSRYDWPAGLKDPQVKAIVKAFNSGELEADKKEKLAALKEQKAKKKADKKADEDKKAKNKRKGKKSDDDDLELDDDA